MGIVLLYHLKVCKNAVFKPITMIDHPLDNKEGKGIPDCKELINTGEFQGLENDLIP